MDKKTSVYVMAHSVYIGLVLADKLLDLLIKPGIALLIEYD